MPGRVPGRSTTRLRRIFPASKSKRRRPRRSRLGKFYRDARQDRFTRVPREKETRSLSRSRAPWSLSSALHDGHLHAHPIRASRASRTTARSNCLRRSHPGNHVDLGVDRPAVSLGESSYLDSLGERLNNSLPRLSRLERFYGERETGPRLRNARYVDSESAPARSAAWARDRRPDPADVEGNFARRARLALPG